MKKLLLISSLLLLIFCENQPKTIDNNIEIIEKYNGAFDTFYSYINILNSNELSEENVAKYFNENFSITGMPNAQFPSIEILSGVYNQIRNNTYPFICSPYDFNVLKFDKLSILPLTDKSVNVSLLDVFYCSEEKIPQYKMCFIYTLIYDDDRGSWFFNNLTELDPKNYPLNWIQVEVAENHKYNNERPISELKPLLASELMKGKKTIK